MAKKVSGFSAILSGGLECCLSCLSFRITFTIELPDQEKVKKCAKRTHRLLSKGQHFIKKTVLGNFGKLPPKPQQRCQIGFLEV
jgi:hypothetical protein